MTLLTIVNKRDITVSYWTAESVRQRLEVGKNPITNVAVI
jgi:hypothetical protein